MTLELGVSESPKKFSEDVANVVRVPRSIKVVDFKTGLLSDKERLWGNLIAVDIELYEQFESIGKEEYCPTFKVKLRNYNGEDLSTLQDAEISFSRFDIKFLLDKFDQPIGLALVLDLADISVK